jgi:hypothetical protein
LTGAHAGERGTMLKRVLEPLRGADGKLVGHFGIAPGADMKLPTKYHL